MKSLLAAAGVATAALGAPGYAQEPTQPSAVEPIAIPADEPAGSSGPGTAAAGAAAVVVIVIGAGLAVAALASLGG